MNKPETTSSRVVGLQERPLGGTVLRTYRRKTDIDDIIPNPRQPRIGPKEDEELQRQIEANEGLFEPLLVEPHPEVESKYDKWGSEPRSRTKRMPARADSAAAGWSPSRWSWYARSL